MSQKKLTLKDHKKKTCPIGELKFVDGEEGTFTGIASVFGVPDRVGDVVERGAFATSIKEHEKSNTVAMLAHHDMRNPIGTWEGIKEGSRGLEVKGRLADTPAANEIYVLLKNGSLNGLSVGFIGKTWEDREDGARTYKGVDLLEVSLVSVPAANQARVRKVKSYSPITKLAARVNKLASEIERITK